MTGRILDETGLDIKCPIGSIRTGWYWMELGCVWVLGPTFSRTGVYYQAVAGVNWVPMQSTTNWVRVHEAVEESGQGFGWRMPMQTD